MFAAFMHRVRRAPVLVLLLMAVLSAGAFVYTLNHMKLNTSVVDLLDPDLPFMRNAAEFARAFPQDTNVIVVVVDGDTPEQATAAAARLTSELSAHPEAIKSVFYPEGDPFFRRNGLLFASIADLESLSGQLAQAQPFLLSLHRDPSLRGLASVLTLSLRNVDAMGGDGRVPADFDRFLTEIAAKVKAAASGKASPFSWESLFTDGPPEAGSRADRRRQILIVDPVLNFAAIAPAGPAVDLIRATAQEAGLTPDHGVRVRLTGELLMLQDELTSVEQSTGVANLVTTAIVILLLVVGLRSFRLVLGTLAALVVGLTLTTFLGLVIFGQFNMISVAFAVLCIGISVDFGIQYGLRYQEIVDRGVPPGLALEEAAAGIGGALTLAAVTAAIGFLSFLPTSYRGLAELGAIAAIGMGLALLTNLTVLPAVIALLPTRARDPSVETMNLQRPLQRFVERHPKSVVGVALALAIGSLMLLPRAWFNDSALDLRDPSAESVATTMELLQDSRVDPYRATILVNNEAEARTLVAKLKALPEVRDATTIFDLVPAEQDEKLRLIDDMALFMGPLLTPIASEPAPSTEELRQSLAALQTASAAAAERYASPGAKALATSLADLKPTQANLDALQSAMLASFPAAIEQLQQSLQASAFTVTDLPQPLRARKEAADGRILVEVFPAKDARIQANRVAFAASVQRVAPGASGEAIIATEGGRAVVEAFLEAGILAAIIILAVLYLVLRSVADTLMVMAPLVLAALLTMSITVLFKVPLNFANVIVWPLLFGLGVASGIYMVLRHRQDPTAQLLETSTPRAVLFSAMTTITSFGSLAIVRHPGMASMGLLLVIAIALSLLSTIIVLPALQVVFGKNGVQPNSGG